MRLKINRTPNIKYTELKTAIEKGDCFFIYSEDLPIELKEGMIFDFETTMKSEPYTLGFVKRNKIVIYQALDDIYDEFMKFISDRLFNDEFEGIEPPFFAYNVSFEHKVFEKYGILTNINDWQDLMQPIPYLNNENEWKDFDKGLMRKEFYVHVPAIDFGSGKDMPYLWSAYLNESDPWTSAKIIYNIIRHNRSCLFKELFLRIMCNNGVKK